MVDLGVGITESSGKGPMQSRRVFLGTAAAAGAGTVLTGVERVGFAQASLLTDPPVPIICETTSLMRLV